MSGLRVYRSNRIEALVEVLASLLQVSPPSGPFVPVEIVVGSRGMERWLRHRSGRCHSQGLDPASRIGQPQSALPGGEDNAG